MKSINYIILLLIVILSACDVNTTKENNENVYEVIEIEGQSIEDFKKRFGSCDYPIKIRLNNSNSEFRGKVQFENVGVKDIILCTDSTCFLVEIDYQLENILFIGFYNVKVTDTTVIGRYACGGPLMDTPANDFLAVKK
ncbi:MAG: hypothetical protein H6743_04925 [Rickettsiaceae bacterium]|nr:hypothetical protein [Rickettsiaceae bacterium]